MKEINRFSRGPVADLAFSILDQNLLAVRQWAKHHDSNLLKRPLPKSSGTSPSTQPFFVRLDFFTSASRMPRGDEFQKQRRLKSLLRKGQAKTTFTMLNRGRRPPSLPGWRPPPQKSETKASSPVRTSSQAMCVYAPQKIKRVSNLKGDSHDPLTSAHDSHPLG